MKFAEYLDGMRNATTTDELEAAIKAPYKHNFRGRVWSQISKVRIEAGQRIVSEHPHAFYIPTLLPRRKVKCCGETFGLGYGCSVHGQNILRKNGLGIRAAYDIWNSDWDAYPHRLIAVVDAALSGKIPDPELHVLNRYIGVGPINYSVEVNNADTFDKRATRPCECGGTLFDWGGGHSRGFEFINWHCNKCPDVFTEYMTREDFYKIRQVGQMSKR